MLHGICHPHYRPVQQPSRGPVPHRKCFPSQAKPFPALKSSNSHVRIAATFVPAINPDDSQLPLPPSSSEPLSAPSDPAFNGSFNSPRTQDWRVYANNTSKNGGWPKDDESALNKSEPLPLPMAYPGSTPNPLEVEEMKECNPEKTDCKDVLYQWTGKCSRCQGTGEVSYFRKKGREVIYKCIICMGLGFVQQDMESMAYMKSITSMAFEQKGPGCLEEKLALGDVAAGLQNAGQSAVAVRQSSEQYQIWQ